MAKGVNMSPKSTVKPTSQNWSKNINSTIKTLTSPGKHGSSMVKGLREFKLKSKILNIPHAAMATAEAITATKQVGASERERRRSDNNQETIRDMLDLVRGGHSNSNSANSGTEENNESDRDGYPGIR